jgi:hypothetical protein
MKEFFNRHAASPVEQLSINEMVSVHRRGANFTNCGERAMLARV